MSNKLKLFLLYMFLFTLPINAQWVDKQGNMLSDTEDMKSAEKLISQLIITDKESEVFKRWSTPSKEKDDSVYFPTTDTIEINKLLTIMIVFGGCSTDKAGNCDLVMKISVFQPDGKVYADLPIQKVCSGKPVPPNNSLGLGSEYVRILIEPNEQLGKYKVQAKIMDKISGKEILLTSHFTALSEK